MADTPIHSYAVLGELQAGQEILGSDTDNSTTNFSDLAFKEVSHHAYLATPASDTGAVVIDATLQSVFLIVADTGDITSITINGGRANQLRSILVRVTASGAVRNVDLSSGNLAISGAPANVDVADGSSLDLHLSRHATSGDWVGVFPALADDLGTHTGDSGIHVPAGGTTNQVLAKASATNGDTTWADAGGAEVNDLTSAVTWANVPNANITEASVTQHQAALAIRGRKSERQNHPDGR